MGATNNRRESDCCDEDLEPTCGGTGWLNCFCGGDFCCCELNGGDWCGGCDDCEEYGSDGDLDWDFSGERNDGEDS
jgi:hypothetical protein